MGETPTSPYKPLGIPSRMENPPRVTIPAVALTPHPDPHPDPHPRDPSTPIHSSMYAAFSLSIIRLITPELTLLHPRVPW